LLFCKRFDFNIAASNIRAHFAAAREARSNGQHLLDIFARGRWWDSTGLGDAQENAI
jgi:hypothetical protein